MITNSWLMPLMEETSEVDGNCIVVKCIKRTSVFTKNVCVLKVFVNEYLKDYCVDCAFVR